MKALKTNHEIGCDLEALANLLEYRGYDEFGKQLRSIACQIK